MTDVVMHTPERRPVEAQSVSMDSFALANADFIPAYANSTPPRWADILDTKLSDVSLDTATASNQFALSTDGGDVVIDGGEAIVGSSVIVRDSTTTYSLPSGTGYNTQPLLIGWYAQSASRAGEIKIGVEADFGVDWMTTEIGQVSAADGTVTLESDTRPVGQENANFRIGSQSDIQIKRVDQRPNNPAEDTWYVIGPDRHVERPTPDGFWERFVMQDIGNMIEDWEDSGGSAPPAWNIADTHSINPGADIEGKQYGLDTSGGVGSSYSHSGLQEYPHAGSWVEFLLRFDEFNGDSDTIVLFDMGIQNGNNDNSYQFRMHVNADQSFQSVRIDSYQGGANQGSIWAYDWNPDPNYTVEAGQPLKVSVYYGQSGEQWRCEIHEFDRTGQDMLIGEITDGPAPVQYNTGGIGFTCQAYAPVIAIDRIRIPPRNPP